MAVSGSAFAVIPMSGTTFYIDYGPCLLVSQFSFAILAARRNGLVETILAACWLTTIVASGLLVRLEGQPSSAFWTIVIGHPFTAFMLVCVKRKNLGCPRTRSIMVTRPLTFYVSHLLIIHLVARIP